MLPPIVPGDSSDEDGPEHKSRSGFRDRAQGSGFMVWGLGFRASALGFFRVQDLGFKVLGLRCRVWGLGFGV